jgi:ABC-2 type transport system permease protein
MLHKIYLIAKREFISRVKKKSFLVMTLLSPILILLFYGLIFYFSFNKDLTEEVKTIIISDHVGILKEKLEPTKTIQFEFNNGLEESQASIEIDEREAYAVLFIKKSEKGISYELIGKEQASIGVVSTLEDKIEQSLKDQQLQQNGINQELLAQINKTRIDVQTRKITQEGIEEGNSGLTTAIGYIGAILIYLFVFLYGVQVMRGVIEEKTNRIVEVIISSVKPFELMMGKISGIALVGLTQFLIWVGLVAALSGPVSALVLDLMQVDTTEISQQMQGAANTPAAQQSMEAAKQSGPEIFKGLENLNLPLIMGMFIFYFISGYLFYGALFAAIGSAVDNETDTQQFMLPVTMPLIFSFVLAQTIVTNDPNSSLSIWLSMIPFSSPIIMMVRLPFGIPTIQILASMAFMTLGFIFTVWLAARIYRIGILTYGKKPSYKELAKWLFRKN